jgi:hypothetical protein
MTVCGLRVLFRSRARRKKRCSACRSRVALSRKSMVCPVPSTARYRYRQPRWPRPLPSLRSACRRQDGQGASERQGFRRAACGRLQGAAGAADPRQADCLPMGCWELSATGVGREQSSEPSPGHSRVLHEMLVACFLLPGLQKEKSPGEGGSRRPGIGCMNSGGSERRVRGPESRPAAVACGP